MSRPDERFSRKKFLDSKIHHGATGARPIFHHQLFPLLGGIFYTWVGFWSKLDQKSTKYISTDIFWPDECIHWCARMQIGYQLSHRIKNTELHFFTFCVFFMAKNHKLKHLRTPMHILGPVCWFYSFNVIGVTRVHSYYASMCHKRYWSYARSEKDTCFTGDCYMLERNDIMQLHGCLCQAR